MDEKSLFQKYQEELDEELKIDDFNVKDKQSLLPSTKHKWVARLIQQRFELDKLHSLKARAVDKIKEKIEQEQEIKLTKSVVLHQAETHETMVKINDKIKETEHLIIYLEKVEKIWAQVTYDIKNFIELKKMETQ